MRFVSFLAATTAIIATRESKVWSNTVGSGVIPATTSHLRTHLRSGGAAHIDETNGDGFNEGCTDLMDRVSTKHQRQLEAIVSEYEGKLAQVRTQLLQQIDTFESFKRGCAPCTGVQPTQRREARTPRSTPQELKQSGLGSDRSHYNPDGTSSNATGSGQRRHYCRMLEHAPSSKSWPS